MARKTYLLALGIGVVAVAASLPSIAFANAKSFDLAIHEAHANYPNVPVVIIKGVIATESSFNPKAKAKGSSARGLMQLTRAAAQDVGTPYGSLFDPRTNIFAGTRYLSSMVSRFGLVGGLRAYYQGAGGYQRNPNAASLAYATKVMMYAAAFTLDLGSWA